MKRARCRVLGAFSALTAMGVFWVFLGGNLGRNLMLTTKSNTWINTDQAAGYSLWQGANSFWSGTNRSRLAHNDGENQAEILLIPEDRDLDKLNDQQMTDLYFKYVNTIQVLCRNQTRLGSFRDGGKEICIDNKFKPRQPCLVYSFGSNFQFDFEQAVINAFKCEVHTFDPSMNLNQKGKVVPPNVHFQLKGLDGHDHKSPKRWEMRTLETIMKELNHSDRIIDILKIDVEGGEWNSLRQMFKAGTLKRAKQLSIEIHFGSPGPGKGNWGGVSTRDQLKVLRDLYHEGYRIFMREHNLFSIRPFKSDYNTMLTNVNELSLINLMYT